MTKVMDGLPFDRNKLGLYGVIGLAIAGAFALGRSQSEDAPIVLRDSPQSASMSKFVEPPTLPRSVTAQPSEADNTMPSAPTKLSVHVTGEVRTPGLFEFEPAERVSDAISKAGGATANADVEALNLAAKLEDGSQLRVPKKGKPTAVAPVYSGAESAKTYTEAPKSKDTTKGGSEPGPGSISLNSASEADLDRLPGVGPSTAKKILDYRQSHGGFASIDELLAVKGIGPKKLADMRKYLRL
ncbi:MAG: helix-hairpin-helix domain-containing protein [Fimbriimonadaceae bacterium]